ncbi:MAG TPA: hypothetical protein VK457_01885 [Chloroflexota bacterium]|nr:hypothetical protein [Chloroflexota bacterium]
MAIEAPVPAQQPATFERPPAFYRVWQAQEGIPIHQRFHLESLTEAELGEWERFGCRGAFVNLADADITTAAILELPPGGATTEVKHLFEALVFVVDGRGRSTISSTGHANVTSAGGDEGPPANQIDYEDEDPTIRELYVRELAARGVELRMPEVQR